MNKSKVVVLTITAAVAGLMAGCITEDRTVVRDPQRAKVEFEIENAARIFYEALSRAGNGERRIETTTKLEIPVVFDWKCHRVTGPNAAFNRAVELCDSNKDGKITEQEAKIYAEHVGK